MRDLRIISLAARRESQPPLVVTVEEAAMMLRIGRGKAYELVGKKLLKSVKIDNCRRVVPASVYEYIQSLTPDDDAA
jgi:excisionase family DNA binding protein